MVGELLGGGGELRVVFGEIADRFDQALDGVIFSVADIARVSKDSPSFLPSLCELVVPCSCRRRRRWT